jgi:hypothetical protein
VTLSRAAVDEAKLEGKASRSVPLTSIRVDNDDVKSEHFRQWEPETP